MAHQSVKFLVFYPQARETHFASSPRRRSAKLEILYYMRLHPTWRKKELDDLLCDLWGKRDLVMLSLTS